MVNSSAVNIPSSDYTSYTLSWGPPGVMASATVCLNPSIPNSCVKMPITVVAPGYYFPTTGEVQGDFGLASGPVRMEPGSTDIGYNSSGSYLVEYSYPTYLERQYGINSYTISFYPLSNGYYSNVSSTTPIGWISFGVYNGNSNTLIPYTMNSLGVLGTTVIFPSSTSGTPSLTDYAVFISGDYYNFFSTSVFQTEIPNFSQSADENACANKYGSGIVNGGFVISYSLQTYSGSFKTESFTTEPSSSFCQAGVPFTLMEGVTVDDGDYPPGSGEIFGLPAMLGHTFTWVLYRSGSNQGFVKGISINP
jgi:hypothetical protein